MKKIRKKNVLLYFLGVFVTALILVYYHHSTPAAIEKTGGARIINTEKVKLYIQKGELANEDARFFTTVSDDQTVESKN